MSSQGWHGDPQPIAPAENQCPIPPSPSLHPGFQTECIAPVDSRIHKLMLLCKCQPNGTIHVALAIRSEHRFRAIEVLPRGEKRQASGACSPPIVVPKRPNKMPLKAR